MKPIDARGRARSVDVFLSIKLLIKCSGGKRKFFFTVLWWSMMHFSRWSTSDGDHKNVKPCSEFSQLIRPLINWRIQVRPLWWGFSLCFDQLLTDIFLFRLLLFNWSFSFCFPSLKRTEPSIFTIIIIRNWHQFYKILRCVFQAKHRWKKLENLIEVKRLKKIFYFRWISQYFSRKISMGHCIERLLARWTCFTSAGGEIHWQYARKWSCWSRSSFTSDRTSFNVQWRSSDNIDE